MSIFYHRIGAVASNHHGKLACSWVTGKRRSISIGRGAVVVKKSRMLQAELNSAIALDAAFTLQIEGKFSKDNGTFLSFTIREK